MKLTERQGILAKVVIDYTDPFLDQTIEVQTNEMANVSYPSHTADSLNEPFDKIASLDGSWKVDGSYALAPDPEEAPEYQMGWWGSQLSGTGGVFTSPYPKLTVIHAPRPIHTLKVVGDSKREEFPVDFQIRLYGEGNQLLYTETVTGNTQIVWEATLIPVLDVIKQELEITKWSLAGRQSKIVEFFTSIQETYLQGDLISFHMIEEKISASDLLPVGNVAANEISLTLSNKNNKFSLDNDTSSLRNLLVASRKVRAWIGMEVNEEIEWVPLGEFWTLPDWNAPDDSLKATVTARDRLELLGKNTYYGGEVKVNVSLGDLAEDVLQDAGLKSEEYYIDPSLDDVIIPYAWFRPVSHRDALKEIALAGLAVVLVDRDGIIKVVSFDTPSVDPPMEITAKDYFYFRASTKSADIINELIVVTEPLKLATVPVEVYRSTTPILLPHGTTVQVTVNYDQPPVMDAIVSLDSSPANVAITDTVLYSWGARVNIENTGSQDQEVVLVIHGKPLSIMNREQVRIQDEDSIVQHSVLRYEYPSNSLIQTLDHAQWIASTLLAYKKDPQQDREVHWKGNPSLLLEDEIIIKGKRYQIIQNEIDWNGSLREISTGRRVI